ncbi:MAG: hypothetical protein KQH53_15550 [Desulfarculaceae bacterium]|nr:hypothetical protein [Desulfarculaceae bacterium]
MTTFQMTMLGVQGLTGLAIVATVIIYILHLQTTRHAAKGQNLIAITNYLQKMEVRDARTHVITVLSRKDYEEWDEEDKRLASLVCSTYDFAAIFMSQKLYDSDLFYDTYGASVCKCFQAVKPHCEYIWDPNRGGPAYWKNLPKIAKKAAKHPKVSAKDIEMPAGAKVRSAGAS